MDAFLFFCSRHPALIHALFFLLGLGFIKDLQSVFLLPLLALLIPLGWRAPHYKALPLLACFLLACLYGYKTQEMQPSQTLTRGVALFVPSEIKPQRSSFKKTELLKGTIRSMSTSSSEKIQNIPCRVPLSPSIKRPFIDSSFYIQGSLEKKGDLHPFFSLRPDSWTAVPYSFSLVEWRFKVKQALSQKIDLLFSDSKVASLMTALTIGTFDDRMLAFDFGKLGLQHILAISGFHFGLLAFLLGLFFRILFKGKIAYLALLLSLTLYFVILGNSPSILRAYLALSLYLLGKLGKWRCNGLNILGTTLFLEMLINPQVVSHLGFQLSFLATFSILFLLPLTKSWMLLFFPHRKEEKIKKLSAFERWTYLSCCFLRSSFALNIAVGLSTIPVCLFYFHKFPLISLAYNLFIPLALSFSLFLFFVSLPFFLLMPPCAHLLTVCNELFTGKILRLISGSPPSWDVYLQVASFPLLLLILILLAVFSLPFLVKSDQRLLLEGVTDLASEAI